MNKLIEVSQERYEQVLQAMPNDNRTFKRNFVKPIEGCVSLAQTWFNGMLVAQAADLGEKLHHEVAQHLIEQPKEDRNATEEFKAKAMNNAIMAAIV